MTPQQFINEYSNEIAMFAKRISFDVVSGDITELVRLWINDTKEFYSEGNREKIKSCINSITK